MTRLFFAMNAADIGVRTADEGRVPLAPLVHVHELTDGGLVMQDGNVRVTAVRTLVLSHLIPAEDPSITDRMWIEAASRHFQGRIIVGRDLLEL